MNTPAHVVVNLALLTRGDRRRYAAAVVTGALVPDLPMFFFYLYQRGWLGMPDALIWSDTYFLDGWQNLFDVFNSLPFILLGLGIARMRSSGASTAFFASMLLHVALDLPLHHDDGHRHLYPLSDWRFESSVSYWDPGHYGAFGALGEVLAVCLASVVLWRRFPNRLARGSVTILALLYVAMYGALYLSRSSWG